MMCVVSFNMKQIDDKEIKARVEELLPLYDHIMVVGHMDDTAVPLQVYSVGTNHDHFHASSPKGKH